MGMPCMADAEAHAAPRCDMVLQPLLLLSCRPATHANAAAAAVAAVLIVGWLLPAAGLVA